MTNLLRKVLRFLRRDSKDPLAELLYQKYRLHAMSIPRQNVPITTMHIDDNRSIIGPTSITKLVKPQFKIPRINKDEKIGRIDGTRSKQYSVDTAIGLLEWFFSTLNIGGVIQNIRTTLIVLNSQLLKVAYLHLASTIFLFR